MWIDLYFYILVQWRLHYNYVVKIFCYNQDLYCSFPLGYRWFIVIKILPGSWRGENKKRITFHCLYSLFWHMTRSNSTQLQLYSTATWNTTFLAQLLCKHHRSQGETFTSLCLIKGICCQSTTRDKRTDPDRRL